MAQLLPGFVSETWEQLDTKAGKNRELGGYNFQAAS